MSSIWTVDNIENKHTVGKIVWKSLVTSLRKHATNIINFEKKEMLPLTKEKLKHVKMQKHVTFVENES